MALHFLVIVIIVLHSLDSNKCRYHDGAPIDARTPTIIIHIYIIILYTCCPYRIE